MGKSNGTRDNPDYQQLISKRKHVALSIDSAIMLEQVTGWLVHHTGLNITHSDSVYMLAKLFNELVEEHDEVFFKAVAYGVAHKVLRIELSGYRKKSINEVAVKLNINVGVFTTILHYISDMRGRSPDDEELRKRAKSVVRLLEEYNDSLYDEFKNALIQMTKVLLDGTIDKYMLENIKNYRGLLKFFNKLSETSGQSSLSDFID
ncbi:hypothetical protein E3E35_01170 [Thermococcus sp. GR7]|uniref:hypothetical protein n=1 Tax=unclassified Thermococcus TaxID=2627626 RepID=UPI00142FD483|nr:MULTISPECIES: hypothetical protein [unclassified Thermococcus]NJE46040.1 hypothetical protein [Thermococcus sp. GR7]NJE79352.1 hypothetical protein [Thermococcus sp. GR4]NJF22237.1 hypothetical protein [Thermococcus sp. GR5]